MARWKVCAAIGLLTALSPAYLDQLPAPVLTVAGSSAVDLLPAYEWLLTGPDRD